MSIELVSIGDELLKGRIVNTNVAFLSSQLEKNGYSVSMHTTLSDHKERLRAGLQEALKRSAVVIATGGLGPTLDDCTREVAAEIFHSDFHIDAAVKQELLHRYADRFFAVEDQARVPIKARVLPNAVGSAPGLVFSESGHTLILLPGVPQEMERLFLNSVLPLLKEIVPSQTRYSAQLHFCLLFESLLDPHIRRLCVLYPDVQVGIYPAHGTLSVVLSAPQEGPVRAFERELLLLFGTYHYEAPTIAEALQQLCIAQGKTLALAESCTGGALAACITAIPGASAYFLGSLVTYSNVLKTALLGVAPTTLNGHGAVSGEVVREMAAGVLERTAADEVIAVSGLAGPSGGSPDKPVGTIFAALGSRGGSIEVGTFRVFGNRHTMIQTTAQYMLGALWRKLAKGVAPFPLIQAET